MSRRSSITPEMKEAIGVPLDSERIYRQVAARIVSMLPDNPAQAHRVLELAAQCLDEFICGVPPTSKARDGGKRRAA